MPFSARASRRAQRRSHNANARGFAPRTPHCILLKKKKSHPGPRAQRPHFPPRGHPFHNPCQRRAPRGDPGWGWRRRQGTGRPPPPNPGTGLHSLTSRPAGSCGGGPLSGPGSRCLRRHTPGIGPGQLDATGPTIDTGRELERPPHPHPHHVTRCQRGARKPGGGGAGAAGDGAGRAPDVRGT